MSCVHLLCERGRWCWRLSWRSRRGKRRCRRTCESRCPRNPGTSVHRQKNRLKTRQKEKSVIMSNKKQVDSLTPPLLSGSVLCPWGRGGVFNLNSNKNSEKATRRLACKTGAKHSWGTWGPLGWSSLCRTVGWLSLCWCPLYRRDTAACWAASPTTERRKKHVKMFRMHIRWTPFCCVPEAN